MSDEIFLIEVNRSVSTVVEIDLVDWTTLQENVDDILADLNNLRLGASLVDVDTAGVEDGDTLIYDEATETWIPGELSTGLEIYGNTVEVLPEAIGINFHASLTATISAMPGGPRAHVQVTFNGSGVANSASRSDHSHSAQPESLVTGAATGNLSSGTRVLRNTAGPTLVAGVYYDVSATFEVRARNNGDTGTVNLLCRVGADGAYLQRSRNVQTVGGVPDPLIIRFKLPGVLGAGAGITEYFAVQFAAGDPTDLRDWEASIVYRPRS